MLGTAKMHVRSLLHRQVAIVAALIGFIVTGFVPSPLGHVTPYAPTLPEFLITVGIYGIGALLVTVFCKVTFSVRGQVKPSPARFPEMEMGRGR